MKDAGERRMENGGRKPGTGHWSLVTRNWSLRRTENKEQGTGLRQITLHLFFPPQSINPSTHLLVYSSQ